MQKHLRWPSLTVEWLPGYTDAGREGWNRHQLLLGTHTDGEENSLLVVAVDLPDVETEIDTRAGEFGKDTSAIALTLPHPGGRSESREALSATTIISRHAAGLESRLCV